MKITKATTLKAKPDFTKLGFGKYFSDYMLVMDYKNGKWEAPEIVPNEPLRLDPATSVLHYAQGIFEGCKAYKNAKGEISLFRVRDNFLRMNNSAAKLCMPTLDIDTVMSALFDLIKLEKDWIPTAEGTSLYVRPTMIATDPQLGVHASHNYKFYVILSPVGAYYANGLQPTKIYVEDVYVRAAIGGTGEAKCMGNYACSLFAAEAANKKGYDQVLWLDAKDRKYVEEVGAMNMFFVIDGVIVTPILNGSILPGITRASAITVLKDNGYKVEERKISIDEIVEAYNNGKLDEAFGTGTAAVVSPVGTIAYKDINMNINNGVMGKITAELYETITGIQLQKLEDKFGWVLKI